MSPRRFICAIAPGAAEAYPAAALIAGSWRLRAPEGRLGACAWALRGFAEHQEPHGRPIAAQSEKDLFS